MEIKSKIRAYCRAVRDNMDPKTAAELSGKLCEQILGWDIYQKEECLMVYHPLGNEVSLLKVVEQAYRQGKRIAFPKVLGESMEFYEVTDVNQLREGCFHVMEPIVQAGMEPVRWMEGLCFVPGVAFDRSGVRLGYGKGYYDRYFQSKTRIVLAGCAYEYQILEDLPREPWDLRMNYLITEQACIQNSCE